MPRSHEDLIRELLDDWLKAESDLSWEGYGFTVWSDHLALLESARERARELGITWEPSGEFLKRGQQAQPGGQFGLTRSQFDSLGPPSCE